MASDWLLLVFWIKLRDLRRVSNGIEQILRRKTKPACVQHSRCAPAQSRLGVKDPRFEGDQIAPGPLPTAKKLHSRNKLDAKGP